jgi:hypothetical protein
MLTKTRMGTLSVFAVLGTIALAVPAAAVDTKVYTGLGCRAAEPPLAPQPTYNNNGGAFNQNRTERLRLLCPIVADTNRILEVKVQVIATNGNVIGCTLRNNGTAQQTASSGHEPYFGNTSEIRQIHLNGHNPSSTTIGAYAMECILPTSVGANAAGILMYRVIED